MTEGRIDPRTGPHLDVHSTLPDLAVKGPRVSSQPVLAHGEHPVPPIDAPLHVVHGDDGWMLRFQGSDTVAGVYPTKVLAMKAARSLARERDLRVIEHGADGRIR